MDIGKLFFGAESNNPLVESGVKGVGPLISSLIGNILVIAGVVMLFFIMWGGLEIIRGSGSADQEQAARGRKVLTTAIVGFLIIVASYFIIQIIEVITGISILK